MSGLASVTVTIAGVTYTLTKDTAGSTAEEEVWSCSAQAPSMSSGMNSGGIGPGIGLEAQGLGYYPGELVATDIAGNTITATHLDYDELKLRVVERTPPAIQSVIPSDGAFITDFTGDISFTITDNGSGINPTSVRLDLDGASYSQGDGLSLSVDPNFGHVIGTLPLSVLNLDYEHHTISIHASDFDGNVAQEFTSSFDTDNIAPQIDIWFDADCKHHDGTIYTGNSFLTKNEESTMYVMSDEKAKVYIIINGTEYTYDIEGSTLDVPLRLGETVVQGRNTIEVYAVDSAHNESTHLSRDLYVDTLPPSIRVISLEPNPADAGQEGFRIVVRITDQ